MSYASVMVHLDRSERAMHRLDLAAQYAQAHGAKLVGIYASFAPSLSWFYMMENAAHYLEEDRIRRDHVHANIVLGELDACNPAELVRCGLGGTVRAKPGTRCEHVLR